MAFHTLGVDIPLTCAIVLSMSPSRYPFHRQRADDLRKQEAYCAQARTTLAALRARRSLLGRIKHTFLALLGRTH